MGDGRCVTAYQFSIFAHLLCICTLIVLEKKHMYNYNTFKYMYIYIQLSFRQMEQTFLLVLFPCGPMKWHPFTHVVLTTCMYVYVNAVCVLHEQWLGSRIL